MSVKWNGFRSSFRTLKGGGPQGATLGLLEYISQSNNNVDLTDDHYKFIDDLSILELVNLLATEITEYPIKDHIPSDIPTHNKYIKPHLSLIHI